MRKPSKNYDDFLLKTLRDDPLQAVEYLNTALEDEDKRVFLLALRQVAEAHGIGTLAKRTHLNRESLYRTLSEKGNPEFSSLTSLLSALDLKLTIHAKTACA